MKLGARQISLIQPEIVPHFGVGEVYFTRNRLI